MNRQIEEMANIACEVVKDDCIIHCNYPPCNQCKNIAEAYYNAGYRKLDDHAIMVLRKARGLEERISKETAKDIFETLLLFLVGETFTVGKELKKVRKKIIKMAEEMGVDLLYEELF